MPIFKMFESFQQDDNYFAKRQGLKTMYMLLVKYEGMRRTYTNDQEKLKSCMNLVLNQNKGIQYEAFLLLSLFILMPRDDEKVFQILKKNKAMLIDFISDF